MQGKPAADGQPYRGCGPTDRYEILVEGHLGTFWSDWFDGLAITYPSDSETLLSGPVVDQAALHGLLTRVRDMNLKLLAVRRL
jgi:hypothetical protein